MNEFQEERGREHCMTTSYSTIDRARRSRRRRRRQQTVLSYIIIYRAYVGYRDTNISAENPLLLTLFAKTRYIPFWGVGLDKHCYNFSRRTTKPTKTTARRFLSFDHPSWQGTCKHLQHQVDGSFVFCSSLKAVAPRSAAATILFLASSMAFVCLRFFFNSKKRNRSSLSSYWWARFASMSKPLLASEEFWLFLIRVKKWGPGMSLHLLKASWFAQHPLDADCRHHHIVHRWKSLFSFFG